MTARTRLLIAAAVAIVGQALSSLATPTLQRWNATPVSPLPKLLLWNASASVPCGLYLLRPARPLRVGEMVAALPPQPLAAWLANRDYLPVGVPLLKRVAALGGQSVCRRGDMVTIDGAPVGWARERDHLGRSLPTWEGCRRLRAGEVFLLNPAVDSMDGRYFGPLPTASVTARAVPLWTERSP